MVNIVSLKNEKTGQVALPGQFSEEFRPDLIARAVRALEANARQPYGADPMAGMQVSAKLSRRRRDYKGSYGLGISRVPRKILSRSGTRFNWAGAEAPGTAGGRRAHPPKAQKIWDQKINTTERRFAIRSAIAASVNKDIVAKRGHKVPAEFPFIIADEAESIKKTKDVYSFLTAIGLASELHRSGTVKIRAGKAKARNRKRKNPVGPLLVVAKACPLQKSAYNIPGVEVCVVSRLNAKLLAPGSHPGRLTLYTESAVKRIASEGLFLQSGLSQKTSKTAQGKN